MVNLKLIAPVLVLAFGLAGCSNSGEIKDQSDSQSTQNKVADSNWKCKSSVEGLGESYGCSTHSSNDEDTLWTLYITCSVELISLHSITGIKSDMSTVSWQTDPSNNNVAKIRIDSQPIEKVFYATKAGGQGIVLGDFRKAYTQEKSAFVENLATWDLLTKIANAESLGFEAYDSDGFKESGKFNIGGSVSVAAKFATLGCKS